MTEYIRTLIGRTSSNHILRNSPESYVNAFAAAISRVYAPNHVEDVLGTKFRVYDGGEIAANVYHEHAAELSVQNHLMLHESATQIGTDKKVNPPKDVDVWYIAKGVNVSLEVKCPVEPNDPDNTVVLRTAGRVPDYQTTADTLGNLLRSADPACTVGLAKNKDNALKEFLTSAHAKFSPASGVSDLNVLLVACGGCMSLQNWHTYLLGEQGLFTRGSFHPPSEFQLVDVVILSNLKYCHSIARASHHWTLDDVFLLPILNPSPRNSRLSSSIVSGMSVFTHHLQRFGPFIVPHAPDVPDYIADRVKVIHYIKESHGLTDLERDLYFPNGVDQ